MLILLSPAKSLDYSPTSVTASTQPALVDQSEMLIKTLRNKSVSDIRELMSISEDLAKLNLERYRDFDAPPTVEKGAKQAILAFAGDTYRDMALEEWSDDDWTEAQKRIRILSGLYGVLRPLDLMLPYRLEMGTRLKTRRGASLYEFWGDRIAKTLGETLDELGTTTTVNLASNEYFKSTKRKAFKGDVVTPVFKDWKNGKYKTISFFAKRARGNMAAWIVRNRVQDAEGLTGYDGLGYAWDEAGSKPGQPLFLRREEP